MQWRRLKNRTHCRLSVGVSARRKISARNIAFSAGKANRSALVVSNALLRTSLCRRKKASRKNRRRARKRLLSSGQVPLGFPAQVISPSAAMMSQSLKHFIRLGASFPTVYRNSVFRRKRWSRKKSMPSKSSASSLNSIPSSAAFTRSMN